MSLIQLRRALHFSLIPRRISYCGSVVSAHLAFGVALLLAGCSSDQPSKEDVHSTSFSCQNEFGAVCGSACSAELPCQTGMYCSSTGTCQADCTQTIGCDNGSSCDTSGTCQSRSEPGEIIIGAETPTGETDSPPDACIEAKVEFNPVIPQVWLLLDRSGSMDEALSGTQRRWDAIGQVLVGDPADTADRGVVGEFESLVAFGATFFSRESFDNCSALLLEETPLALDSYDAVNTLYLSLEPGTGTPTAEAYADLAVRVAAAPETSGPKIIIAATDGAPSKCGIGDAQEDVEAAVADAYGKRIQTFVINVGDNDSDQSHLQRVANLGQGLTATDPSPAEFYSASDQDALKDAFRSIIGTAASCTFELNGSVSSSDAAQGKVELLGQAIEHEAPNGWVLRSETEIEITGAACETIQAGISETDLTIRFPCGVFVVR